MRQTTITCDRCGESGDDSPQAQEGWTNLQVFAVASGNTKFIRSLDFCYGCQTELNHFLKSDQRTTIPGEEG